jgi:hypothetical protein
MITVYAFWRVSIIKHYIYIVFIGASNPWDKTVWTGATDRETEGIFKWNVGNGDRIYPNWHPHEPNNSNNEDCIVLMRNGYFGDMGCYHRHVFVCERDQNV